MIMRSTIHFALVGPFVGTTLVFIWSNYLTAQPLPNYGGLHYWLILGYLFSIVPAALTGIVNGIANNSLRIRKAPLFYFNCAVLSGMTGCLFSVLMFLVLGGGGGSARGFFIWGVTGALSGVLCSLSFNGSSPIRHS